MKRDPALSAFSILSVVLALPAFGGEPKLNVEAICKSRATDAGMLRSAAGQNMEAVVHDEEAAKAQLSGAWASASIPIRNRCESDARSLRTAS